MRRSEHASHRVGALAVLAATALVTGLVTGCAQDVVPLQDGGNLDGGDLDGGRDDAGVSDGTITDAGFDDGAVPDSGPGDVGRDAGTLAPLTFGQMSGAGLPSDMLGVNAVWGRSATEVYIGTGRGRVYRFDGSAWAMEVQPGNNGITAMGGTSTRLYIGSGAWLYVWDGAQLDTHIVSQGRSIEAIWAVSDTEVYVSAEQQNGQTLFRFDGAQLVEEYVPQVAIVPALYGEGGDLYLGGSVSNLIERRNNVYFTDLAELPVSWDRGREIDMTFHDFGRIGSELFAVGSNNTIFKRDADGMYRVVRDTGGVGTAELRWVGGHNTPDGPEGYAAGYNSTESPILRYYDGRWTEVPITANWRLVAGWSAGPDLYYFVGSIANSATGVVVVGQRP